MDRNRYFGLSGDGEGEENRPMTKPTEMELRVAEAAHNRCMADDWDDLNPNGIERALWLETARAAIRAMREPTQEMTGIIDSGHFKGWGPFWAAMIDAASPPEPEQPQ